MRRRIILITATFIFALSGCASVEADQEKAPVPTEMTISVENPQMPTAEQEGKTAEDTTTTNDKQVSMAQGEEIVELPDQNEIFKAVLLGDSPFFYCSDGKAETMVITDVPVLFDEYDPLMKIWEFSVVDLNGDGEDEVILFVVGVAGDMGGKVILHQIGNKIYGYTADNRTLLDLKMDGSYGYSDPTGVTEVGIAAIVDFSEAEYTVDKISYAIGTYKGLDSFVADYQPVTEEEYLDVISKQNQKENAEWYEFTDENINILF